MFVNTPSKGKGRNPIKTLDFDMPEETSIEDETNIVALFWYFQSLAQSVSDIGSALLGLTRYIEAKYHVMEEDITKLHTQTEDAHTIIRDDKELYNESGTLWGWFMISPGTPISLLSWAWPSWSGHWVERLVICAMSCWPWPVTFEIWPTDWIQYWTG